MHSVEWAETRNIHPQSTCGWSRQGLPAGAGPIRLRSQRQATEIPEVLFGSHSDDDLVRDMAGLVTSLCARALRASSGCPPGARAVEVATSGAGTGGGHDG